ncbi:hypothetical protein AOC36_08660 [Erysipelothrix larvae]|uniref:N-acetyltransferase domain-containing protein n=1 Tax=Erysipelothrix larvae TaxID=1514105 RepID=A0A0X8H108_9FIRM|nr:GNAT family N-acetyltransferase [Erysipelothrix larvae]AMC94056.1 hypothetical protein AOC36_08660 [Erysipelothrix larvae]
MTPKNYELKPLQWDTDYFGVKAARVNLTGIVNENNQKDIIKFCARYDFVTISNIDNIQENNQWIGNKTSAFLVDMNIQFKKTLGGKQDYQDDKTYVVSNMSRNDQIMRIAKKSFSYSRFFNDPNLPKSESNNIYLHWTEDAFNQENKFFVISEREGNIVGFILFSLDETSSVIELIAVEEKYKGKRVGKSLIHTMESFVIDQGIKNIKVGTQVNNISAVQFYLAIGFKYVGCVTMYHLWGRYRSE